MVWGTRVIKFRYLFATALGAIALTAQPAAAGVYDFTYVQGLLTASGQLTVTPSSGDSDLVTGISGTWDGQTITALIPPGGIPFSPTNDNLLFPEDDASGANSGYIDYGGLGFEAGGVPINLIGIDLNNYDWFQADSSGNGGSGDGVLALSVSVPEPATWALMLAGFGGLGAVLRRRRANAMLAA